ncbi:hypothetical protein EJ06DRAFT_196646 [Trichodelitschia bisporula]|uniref:Uncharacterized protein n=1 Tax=Trichodelitschia bisporula TaxID=703511 RepID=A0A6G1I8F7_9PEZI|nr:hypothetical protein EJ06DRAFT_196646 [Trichodelitschia bisporula]
MVFANLARPRLKTSFVQPASQGLHGGVVAESCRDARRARLGTSRNPDPQLRFILQPDTQTYLGVSLCVSALHGPWDLDGRYYCCRCRSLSHSATLREPRDLRS